MTYRKQSKISRETIEKAMDSINSSILSIGVHPTVIDGITINDDTLSISLQDTNTNIYCKVDSYLFNSLLAAVSFADRDLLWDLKNNHNFDLLVGLKLKVVVGVGWGYTVIKQNDEYHVVDTKTTAITSTHNNHLAALKERDRLGRAYLNVYKCLPHSKEVTKARTLSKIERLNNKLKGREA